MTTANLVSCALQTGVVLLIGFFAPRVLRLRAPGVALRYWQLLLATVLLLPFLQPWRVASAGSVTVEAVGALLTSSARAVAPASRGATVTGWILLGLALVAAVRLIWLAVGLVVLRSYRRAARPLGRVPRAVIELLGASRTRVRLLVSNRIPVPVTFGWLRPTVLLPRGFEDLPEPCQVSIACHELMHVQRRDWLAVVTERSLRALLWFHPAVPILLRRIGLSREQIVDREVVRLTGRRRDYLDALWSMARWQERATSTPALSFLDRSDLFERVALLTREVKMSKLRLTAAVTALVAMVGMAAVAVAATFPLVRSSADGPAIAAPVGAVPLVAGSDDEPVPYHPGGEVTEPKVISRVKPVYPEDARKKGLEGIVVCQVVITTEGAVSNVKVVKASDEVFEQPTVDALRQWTFEPATLHGKPVDVIFMMTVAYRLDEESHQKGGESDG